MESSGHFGFSATVTYVMVWLANYFGISISWRDGAVLILGSAFLASLPDIDIRLRRIGFRHRGFTHTIWFALVLGVLTYISLNYLGRDGVKLPITPILAALTVFLAVITHIAADALNYQRVRPFAPLSDVGIALHLFRSGNRVANSGFFLIGLSLVVIYFYGLGRADIVVQAALAGVAAVAGLAAVTDRVRSH